MAERIFDNPFAFIVGCAVWLPLGFWVVSIVGWMIQGELDAIAGLIAIVAAFVLGYYTMMPPLPWMGPVFFVGAVSLLGLYPAARAAFEQRALVKIDIETIEKCYLAIRERPNNVGAYLRLARTLYARGLKGQAVSIAESVIKGLPRVGFEEEMRQVRQWKQLTKPDDFIPIECIECGVSNDPVRIFCRRCGSDYLADYAKGRWISRRSARKLVLGWAIGMMALLGVPLSMETFSGTAGYLTAIGVLLAAITVGYFVLRLDSAPDHP